MSILRCGIISVENEYAKVCVNKNINEICLLTKECLLFSFDCLLMYRKQILLCPEISQIVDSIVWEAPTDGS